MKLEFENKKTTILLKYCGFDVFVLIVSDLTEIY